MADYWKSNPRRFCEVCKCWFGDNKASIDFHERGKRHQENVKKLLSSARRKTAENEKEAKETDKMLASIEQAAAAAYIKDLDTKLGGSALPNPQPTTLSSAPQEPPALEPFEVRKAKAHLEILHTIQSHQEKKEREAAMVPPPPPPSVWQQAATPEGHLYYYNIFTRETQWEQPEDFQPLPTPPVQPSSTEGQPSEPQQGAPSILSDALAAEEQLAGKKRSSEDVAERGDEPAPKRPVGPYGGWTTVAIHPQQPEAEEEEESDSSHDDDSDEGDTRRDEEEEKVTFDERTLTSLPEKTEEGGGEMRGSFTGFSFKKRTTGRPQIRQRTSELS